MPNSLRFISGAGQDNTLRTVTQDAAILTYAATIAITPVQQINFYQVALTGAATINASVASLYIGDIVRMQFSADAGGARVVTFGTGFASAGTISVAASKFGFVDFIFNGTVLQEMGRAATA